MALRIDQLLTHNHGAFDLINVKSPYVPDWGGGGGGGGFGLTTDRCITEELFCAVINRTRYAKYTMNI